MDTQQLIEDVRERFNQHAAKEYLKQKHKSKLIFASQNGLWSATPELISFLDSFTENEVVLLDDFGNPIKVSRPLLLDEAKTVYRNVMDAWYTEWKTIESRR